MPGGAVLDAARGYVHHRAGKALVGDDEVAAATEHEQRLTALIGRLDLGHDRRLGGRLDQPARGTAETQRGVVRQGDLLTDGQARSRRCQP